MAAIAALVTRARAPVERPTTIYLNDEEWLTVQTTPIDLHDWAIGYLCGEGVVDAPSEISSMVVDEERGLVWVDVPQPHTPETLTFAPIHGREQVADESLLRWMKEMLASAPLYQETGGMHVAMAVRLDTDARIVREDIGRHNAVDKVLGAARKAGWPADRTVILTSGRISYEMCSRLARFGAGIGISRTAATDQAYDLATTLGIELVGYVRTSASLIVYTDENRVLRRIKE